ncbi:hypothetical protein M5K25_027438 [Dendrobium thyrsiflorum]|uniref:Uncharacterized protein n=1 Tax=Dendrobium thyrsiflorum TaxID=117978 RepID=A0ABD0U092_DENTH
MASMRRSQGQLLQKKKLRKVLHHAHRIFQPISSHNLRLKVKELPREDYRENDTSILTSSKVARHRSNGAGGRPAAASKALHLETMRMLCEQDTRSRERKGKRPQAIAREGDEEQLASHDRPRQRLSRATASDYHVATNIRLSAFDDDAGIPKLCASEVSNLHPRNPSMGFTSVRFSILEITSSSVTPVCNVNSFTMSSMLPSGRNSWSGGSNRRILAVNADRNLSLSTKFFSVVSTFLRANPCNSVDVETISPRFSKASSTFPVRTQPLMDGFQLQKLTCFVWPSYWQTSVNLSMAQTCLASVGFS